jgi:hypothetical protein
MSAPNCEGVDNAELMLIGHLMSKPSAASRKIARLPQSEEALNTSQQVAAFEQRLIERINQGK